MFNATYRVKTVCDSPWGYTYDRDVETDCGFATPEHARLFVDVLNVLYNDHDDDDGYVFNTRVDRLTVWDPCCDADPTVVDDVVVCTDGEPETLPF